ncbi:MAG: NHL repeat-containing protein [Candidatus Eremiobacteraeota bacterium]|nr:NHL repeat-containing protein [Candidatus Eremiobacteraeota bacterium]
MLRRFFLAFVGAISIEGLAACGSTSNQAISIGPNFATGSLYVTNSNVNSISIFAPNAATGAHPVNSIGGSSTGLTNPQYIAFDVSKRAYVSNYNTATSTGSITAYASQATGSVLPLAVISGAATTLGQARGITVDAAGNIYVANVAFPPSLTSSILVFAAGASGNTAPARSISGALTLLAFPAGIAINGSANIFVANSANASIEQFSSAATGNMAPTKTIVGPLTGLVVPAGLTLDLAGNIYVTDVGPGNSSIVEFAASATGNSSPMRVIAGSLTTLNNPSDIKLDAAGNIYVTNTGTGNVLVFSNSASGNVAPTAVLNGAGNVVGLALSP